MLTLTAAAKLAKNKIASGDAWLVLLDIALVGGTTLRVCRNTEDVTWPTVGGNLYTAFPFDISSSDETSKGEIPQLTISVSNVTRTMQGYLELETAHGVGATVTVRVVNSGLLAEAAAIEEVFEVLSVGWDAQNVTFKLGGAPFLQTRVPERRYMKNFCPLQYNSIECGVASATFATYPLCNKTLADCRTRTNNTRFGGEPAIPQGGIYVS